MACRDMNRIIADNPMHCRQWPASIALENLSEALGLMGPNLSFFVDGSYQFTDVLQVLHSCDHKKLTVLLKKFVCAAKLNGQEVNEGAFNIVYGGDLARVFDVFAFVCEVNYRDFFEQGVTPPEQDQSEQSEEQLEPDLLMQSMTP